MLDSGQIVETMSNDVPFSHLPVVESESYDYSDNTSNYDTGNDQNYILSAPYTYLHRMLASSTLSKYKIDYNVLSVAAMTLALIMMVEYVRHRLDHWAYQAATTETPQQAKQPLFRAVLEGVYAERKC
jgi:hypothetical protein